MVMSRWAVNPRPEEKEKVGCKIAVKLSKMVVYGENRSMQGAEGGGMMIQVVFTKVQRGLY